MSFPELFGASVPVAVRRRVDGVKDRHGNATVSWVDEVIHVFGVAPRQRTENDVLGRDFSTLSGWEIYAPKGTQISAHDRVVLPEGVCEVVGEPARWDFTPPLGNPVAGVVFTVQLAKG
mgnify:CR=1 FL=1